jgi:pimeloyl-ACP methyl ester carboxylesterase
MEAMEVVQILGFFGPLPTRLLNSGLSLDAELPAPLSCIVLTQDKLISPQVQRRTAERLNSEEVLEVDACHMGVWQRPHEVADALLRYA